MLAISLVVLLCRLLLVLIIYHCCASCQPFTPRRIFGGRLLRCFLGVLLVQFRIRLSNAGSDLGLGRDLPVAPRPTCRRSPGPAALLYCVAGADRHCGHSPRHKLAWCWRSSLPGRRRAGRPSANSLLVPQQQWELPLPSGPQPSAPRLVGYFVPIFSGVLQSAQAFLAGTSGHHIFGASGGTPPAADWERVVLVVYTSGTPLQHWYAPGSCFHELFIIGIACLVSWVLLDFALPFTAAAHFNPSVAELGSRADTFLFLPLALSCSLIIQRHPRVTRSPASPHNPFRPAVLIALIGGTTIAYLGGTLLGSNPDWIRLPGPYLVSADFRTQDPETLAAVDWAATHLPTGSTVAADRVPAVLLGSQARLWPVTHSQQGLEPARIVLLSHLGPSADGDRQRLAH